MQFRRRIILFFILAIVIFAIGYGFVPKPEFVETAEVRQGYMKVAIYEDGKTRVMNRYVVSAPVAGFALRIKFDVGDSVSKGQMITELEPLRANVLDPRSRAEANARIAAGEAKLRAAKENAQVAKVSDEFAKKELERARQLFEDLLITEEKLDEVLTESRQAEATSRSFEFAVDVARNEKNAALTVLKYSAANELNSYEEKVIIKSPIKGHILKINNESEGVVREGQALMEIGDLQALEIVADVLSADAVRITSGTPVLVERWGGGKPLKGQVRIVEPVGFTKISALGVEEQRVLVLSDIVSPPKKWKQLGDGYRVEVSFVIWEDDNVLQVPTSAIFRLEDEWAVFVITKKRAHLRIVKVGYIDGMTAQIVSGIAKGDTVIVHPDSSIKDGSRVRFSIYSARKN